MPEPPAVPTIYSISSLKRSAPLGLKYEEGDFSLAYIIISELPTEFLILSTIILYTDPDMAPEAKNNAEDIIIENTIKKVLNFFSLIFHITNLNITSIRHLELFAYSFSKLYTITVWKCLHKKQKEKLWGRYQ